MLATILSFFGCGPKLTGTGPGDDATPAPAGIRYYTAKEVAVFEVTVTESETLSILGDLTRGPTVQRDSTAVNLSLKTVPDPSSYCVLNLAPGGTKDQTLSIAVSPAGLLTNVNVEGTDRTGEIVTNVAKAVASVAGAFVGFRGLAVDGPEVDRRFGLTSLAQLPAAPKAAARRRFGALPAEVLYFVDVPNWQVIALVEDLVNAQIELDGMRAKLLTSTRAAGAAASDAQEVRVAEADTRIIALLEAQVADIAKALAAVVEEGKTAQKIGKRTTSRKAVYVMELAALPSFASVPDPATAGTVLTGDAKRLFDDVKVIVTYDPQLGVNPDRVQPAVGKRDEKARIFYRDPRPATFRIFGQVTAINAAGVLDERVRLLETRSQLVLDPRIKPTCLEYEAKAFSTQKLQLAFDEQGRFKGVTQGATSPIAGAVAAGSGAVTGARDEFVVGLTKAKEAITARQQIDQSYLQAQVDTLTKRKQVVDGELALQGAQANVATNLEKQRIDAQLALLTQQLALNKAQGTLEDAVAQAKTSADVELLKQQIELLKQQVELVRQEAALRDAKKAAQPPAP